MQTLTTTCEPRSGPATDHSVLSRLLTVLMDRFECGVLSCGPDGELLHANTAARRELASARVMQLCGDRVRTSVASQAEWSNALRDAALRARTCMVGLGDGEERLMIALMPIHVDGLATPACIAMMGRRAGCSILGLEMLSSNRGLTYAERRVLRALVENQTAREIADAHGVAVTTVRTQIQSVRDKLGARSIEALLLQAAGVPPVAAQY